MKPKTEAARHIHSLVAAHESTRAHLPAIVPARPAHTPRQPGEAPSGMKQLRKPDTGGSRRQGYPPLVRIQLNVPIQAVA